METAFDAEPRYRLRAIAANAVSSSRVGGEPASEALMSDATDVSRTPIELTSERLTRSVGAESPIEAITVPKLSRMGAAIPITLSRSWPLLTE